MLYCSNWPVCKHALPIDGDNEMCNKCGAKMIRVNPAVFFRPDPALVKDKSLDGLKTPPNPEPSA